MPRSWYHRLGYDLAYWPMHNSRSFTLLAASNSLRLAIWFSLLGRLRLKRLFLVRLHGVEVWVRSGTPDLVVAAESLGAELDQVIEALPAETEALIVDGGGYIGTAAIKLARAFPRCRVITVEPSSNNLEVLRRNVAAYPNIAVVRAALAATESVIELRDIGNREWGYTILADKGSVVAGRAVETVPTLTVEGILAHEGAERLFLLKLDVEGAEVEILAAGAAWLARTDVLVAELHENLVPGAEAAFELATAGRRNCRLPGEKVMSVLEPAMVSRVP